MKENLALKEEIMKHLECLEVQLTFYFPELKDEESALVRNPFSHSLDVALVSDKVQDKLIDMRNDSSARDVFKINSVIDFWS